MGARGNFASGKRRLKWPGRRMELELGIRGVFPYPDNYGVWGAL